MKNERRNLKKRWMFIVSVFLFACFSSLNLHAEQLNETRITNLPIKGKVIDAAGDPLIGVSVIVKGTTNGTATDVEGNFNINIPENSTLVFNYVGFITQEIRLKDSSPITIKLLEDRKMLDEVVVVGYTTQKKADLTGSVASLKLNDVQDMAVSDISNALEGRMSGVVMMSNGGMAGSGSSIRIRGMGTFGGVDPLVIIDGVPSGLAEISPSDVESIDILKDASSAAIYGSRAANGVVIIRTKKGSYNDKMKINFSTSLSFHTPKKVDLLNAAERNMIHTEAYENSKLTVPKYYSQEGSNVTRTNWLDEVLQTGFQQNYDLNVTGGGEKARYNISVGHMDQDGVLKENSFKRSSFRVNTEFKPFKNFTLGENLLISQTKKADVKNMGRSGAIGAALLADPAVPVFDDKGNYSGSGELAPDIRNPYAVTQREDDKTQGDKVLANIYASYKLFDSFTIKTEFGYDRYQSFRKVFDGKVPESGWPRTTNDLSEIKSDKTRWLNTTTVQFQKEINKHSIMVLGGTAYEEEVEDWSDIRVSDFVSEDPKQRYLSNGRSVDWVTGGKNDWALFSYIARADYAYDSRYLLSASFRADGSSKFRKDNRWGYFPSASAGWRVSEETFFEPAKASIENLKLRASWGQLGNQDAKGYYPTYLTYKNTNADDGQYVIFGKNENSTYGRHANSVANPDLKWETTSQIDLGFDINFLNHWSVEFDYYIKKSKDVLIPVNPSYLSGIGEDYSLNAASVNNKGFDIQLGYNARINQDFEISATGNLGRVKNEVTEMGAQMGGSENLYPSEYRSQNVTRIAKGYEIGHFFGYKTGGIFKSEDEIKNHVNKDGNLYQPNAQVGDVKFIDVDEDGKIGSNDRTYLGSGFPDFSYGFGADIKYKNFDFNIFFQGVAGYDILNLTKFEGAFIYSPNYNQLSTILDRYHPEKNPSGNWPRVLINDPNNNKNISDLYVDKADYLKLKVLTLGYTLSKDLARKVYAENIRLYFTAQNLLTFTSYKGFDPETITNKIGKTAGEAGVDRGQFPQPRAFVFGLNINF